MGGNKLILTFALALILIAIAPLASAVTDNYYDAHNQNLSANTGATAGAGNQLLDFTTDVNMTYVTRYAGTNPTVAYVYQGNYSNATCVPANSLGSCNFSGDTCTFSSPIQIDSNNEYTVCSDNGGASYLYAFDDFGAQVTGNTTLLNYSYGWFATGSPVEGRILNLAGVGFTIENVTPTTPNPFVLLNNEEYNITENSVSSFTGNADFDFENGDEIISLQGSYIYDINQSECSPYTSGVVKVQGITGNESFCYYQPTLNTSIKFTVQDISFFNNITLYRNDTAQTPICVEDWVCNGYGNATCLINDTSTASCNSVIDNNACGTNYTGDYSEFTNQTGVCDFCTPSFASECTVWNTSACPAQNYTGNYSCIATIDANSCFSQTSLPSDAPDFNALYGQRVCSELQSENSLALAGLLVALLPMLLICVACFNIPGIGAWARTPIGNSNFTPQTMLLWATGLIVVIGLIGLII